MARSTVPIGFVGTHQLAFLVPRQIAEMRDTKAAERDDAADRVRVLGGIRFHRLEAGAERIRPSRAGQSGLENFSSRRHDAPVDASQRQTIARLHDRVLRRREQPRVRLVEKLGRRRLRLNRRPVIDVVPDRHTRRHLRHPAKVIAVPVRRDQVIDLREPRILDRRHNPPRIATRRRATVPGVDEHGFSGGRHEQASHCRPRHRRHRCATHPRAAAPPRRAAREQYADVALRISTQRATRSGLRTPHSALRTSHFALRTSALRTFTASSPPNPPSTPLRP